jgi:hypothetical protein
MEPALDMKRRYFAPFGRHFAVPYNFAPCGCACFVPVAHAGADREHRVRPHPAPEKLLHCPARAALARHFLI